jgi:hypothetical protein
LTGTFEATDLDSNSLITQNEVTNFEVILPSTAFISPLRYNLDNLVILTLDLTNFNNYEFLATDSIFLREFATVNNIFEQNSNIPDLVNLVTTNDPNATAIATSNRYNPFFIRDIGTTVLVGNRGGSRNVSLTVELTESVSVLEPSTVSTSALTFCILAMGFIKKKLKSFSKISS